MYLPVDEDEGGSADGVAKGEGETAVDTEQLVSAVPQDKEHAQTEYIQVRKLNRSY